MSDCSASELLAASACFCGLGEKDLELVKISLMCRLWQANDPMAICDATDLLESARCFDCLTPKQLSIVQTELLCEILQSGGGGGQSCLLCGDVDPTDAPECDCAIYYNKTTGSLWIWYVDLIQWFSILGP